MLAVVQDLKAILAPSPSTLLIKTYDVAARSKLGPKVSPLGNEPRDRRVVCDSKRGREPVDGGPERALVRRGGANGGANGSDSAFAFRS
jgi:hypothetical protein